MPESISERFRPGPRLQVTPLQPQPGTEGFDLTSAHTLDGLDAALDRAARELDLDEPRSPEALVAALHGEEALDDSTPENRVRLQAASRLLEGRQEAESLGAWTKLQGLKAELHTAAEQLVEDEWDSLQKFGSTPQLRRHFADRREDTLHSAVDRWLDTAADLRDRLASSTSSQPTMDADEAGRISLELTKLAGKPNAALRDRIARAADEGDTTLLHHLRDELDDRLRAEGLDPEAASLQEVDATAPDLARARRTADLALTTAPDYRTRFALSRLDRMTHQAEVISRVVEENARQAQATLHERYPAWRDVRGSTSEEAKRRAAQLEEELLSDLEVGWDGPRARMHPRATPDFPAVGPTEQRAHPDAPTFDPDDAGEGEEAGDPGSFDEPTGTGSGFYSRYPGATPEAEEES